MKQVTPCLGLRSLDVPSYLPGKMGRGGGYLVPEAGSGAPEKASGVLSRLFTKNRSAVVSKFTPAKQDLSRREFLKKMRAGAIADSPLGSLAAVDADGLLGAAAQASLVRQVAKSAPDMTRRQALGGISAVAAGYGSAATEAAKAVAPAVRSSSPLGAWRAVSGTPADLALARAMGVQRTRARALGVHAGYKLAKNPLDDPMGRLSQMAIASPGGAVRVAKVALQQV